MRFSYCPDCGSKLSQRVIGDEGLVPWCDNCARPLFDMFSSCIIVLVVNEQEEAALLIQNFLSATRHTLVSGYIKPGETAEDCARREVQEEIGITVEQMEFAGTYWLAKKDQLMIGFIARAKKAPMKLSVEINQAEWVPVRQAIHMVHGKGSVSYALVERYLEQLEKQGDTSCD